MAQEYFDDLAERSFSEDALKFKDDDNGIFKDAIEFSILALSKRPAVTQKLLFALSNAYDECGREYYGRQLDDLLDKVNAIVNKQSKENSNKVINLALSQKLSADDKAAINQIYSAAVIAIVNDIRDAVIDIANEISGEPVEPVEYFEVVSKE